VFRNLFDAFGRALWGSSHIQPKTSVKECRLLRQGFASCDLNRSRVTRPGLVRIRGAVPPAVGYCAIAGLGELHSVHRQVIDSSFDEKVILRCSAHGDAVDDDSHPSDSGQDAQDSRGDCRASEKYEDLLVFLAQHRIERVIDATYVEVPITFHHIAQPDVRSHRIPVRVERPCRNLTTVSVSITLP
jgi:hypothetical protein